MGFRSIKWKEPETWIIIVCVIVMVLFMTYVLNGCSTSKQAQKMDIIWHDGKCLLIADGMSATQAKEMMSEWQFRECEIIVEGTESSGSIKLKKQE